MITLGISEEHDSGIALIENGKIIFAINEERLNRKKGSGGFPFHALTQAIDFLKVHKKENDIKDIAVASLNHVHSGAPENFDQKEKIKYDFFTYLIRFITKKKWGKKLANNNEFAILIKHTIWLLQSGRRKRLKKHISNLTNIDFKNIRFDFVDHHLCHAYSAYYTSGYNNCLALTFDAQGDGVCSRAFRVENGVFHELKFQPFFVSVGYYYTIITVVLGFKGGQEGKVTGLSARGNHKQTYQILKERLSYDSKQLKFNNQGMFYLDEIDFLKKKLKGYSREDVAAGIQYLMEEYISQYTSDIIDHFDISKTNVCLAGGIFANVLLNQKLTQIKKVKKLFIHPHMGDGGLAAGAAFSLHHQRHKNLTRYRLESVYLGSEYTDRAIKAELELQNITYSKPIYAEKKVASLLSKGNIVCLFQGRMEYGPRSLGNRSIIGQAKDVSINDNLNIKLGRSEFMPFAPSIIEEYANEYFDIMEQNHACEFMTMVVNCTKLCKENAPAIVHVDGTARPHIVRKSINPRYYNIIREFYQITRVPILLNTSFNMHEEPIVESPKTAINSFIRSKIDYLLIGSYLIAHKDNVRD